MKKRKESTKPSASATRHRSGPSDPRPGALSIFQDTRKRAVLYQFVFAVVVIYLISAAYGNVIDALAKINMIPSFKFLKMSSNIDIGESPIAVTSSSTNARVLLAGFLNTVSISFLAIVFSIFIGLGIALCRLSANWLLSKIAQAYIEIIRNIPLLLLLLIWYRAFFLRMPGIRDGFVVGERMLADGTHRIGLSISNRGLSMTWFKPTEHLTPWLVCLAVALCAAIAMVVWLRHRQRVSGKEQRTILYPLLAFLVLALASYFLLPNRPLVTDVPVMGRFNLSGGLHVSSEWFSLFSGLVLYTSGFIAEIFRAGIQGIPKGQVEAARSLGFSHMKTLRLVVIPQAKVVVIPPLTSQCLGVAKNTSLGVAIGFPDLFAIAGTMINQTGRALEMILIVMVIYLGLSLLTSLVMNQYNKRVQIKER